jgi:hypothetical protein
MQGWRLQHSRLRRRAEQYADEANIHRTYVSDLERGARNPGERG